MRRPPDSVITHKNKPLWISVEPRIQTVPISVACFHVLISEEGYRSLGSYKTRLNIAAAHLLKKLADRVSMMAGTVTLPAQ